MLSIKRFFSQSWINIKNLNILPYISFLALILPLLILTPNNSLMAHDEGLYAIRARLMFDSGDWIHPWSNPHHKTPGFYWLIATSYHLFGINEFSVRLPNMILGILSVFILYEIAKLTLNSRIAWLAGAILSLQFLWVQYCRLGTPDIPMVFLVLLGLLSLLKAESFSKMRFIWCFISGFCFGVGLLVRSMMIFLPIIALLPYLILENRRHRLLNSPSLYLGFIVGIIPTCVWIWLSYLKYGNEAINKLFGFVFRLAANERGGNGFIYYLWNIPIKSFPWFLFALIGLLILLFRPQPKYQLLLVGFPLLFFTEITIFSTRLSHYSLSLYPFIAILAAVGLDKIVKIYADKNINQEIQDIFNQQLIFHLKKLPQYLSYSFGIFGLLIAFVAVIAILSGNYQKYATVLLSAGLSFLILPIVWIGRYRFKLKFIIANYWLAGWLFPVWLTLIIASWNGLLSDYNPEFRQLAQQGSIAQILTSSPVNLVEVGGKTGVLIEFYTKNINNRVDSLNQLPVNSYAWVETKILKISPPHRIIGTIKEYSLVQVSD